MSTNLKKFHVVLVVGEICSGKSTYAQRFASYAKVDVGDIVRALTFINERTHNPELSSGICQVLYNRAYEARYITDKNGILITGIRQIEIVKYIEQLASSEDWNLNKVLLDVPLELLKARYEQHPRTKDSKLTFEQSLQRDNHLGLGEVIKYFKETNCQIIKNYSHNETYNSLQEIKDRQDSTMDNRS
jgi:predicted kinase